MKNLSLESELRLRVSSKNAHYAGGLVDGAYILNLFGDVATELTIRIDGDEGLLRSYDNVEFLSPVYAGDFLLIKGKVVKIGNTSRKIIFEAYKIIEPIKNSKFDSNCKVLDPPLLVAKASGTSVVLKEKQKK
jgi:3-aminobutyryl-CoA ammonia-lyase